MFKDGPLRKEIGQFWTYELFVQANTICRKTRLSKTV